MPKKQSSKLDQFREQLLEMEAEGKTLEEMLAWLKEESCFCALSTLSRWLEPFRRQDAQDRVLAMVASGSRQCQALDQAFTENPAPEMATVVNVFKVLVMELATKGTADTKLLKLSDQLARTAIEFINATSKAKFKQVELDQAERKLLIAEKRAAQAEATEKVLTDAELTPEQRAERIKEIYGR